MVEKAVKRKLASPKKLPKKMKTLTHESPMDSAKRKKPVKSSRSDAKAMSPKTATGYKTTKANSKFTSTEKKSTPATTENAGTTKANVLLNKKETRDKMKATKVKRKSVKNTYEDTVELKKMWEILRKKKLNLEEGSRDRLCEKILKRIKGRESQFLYAHDTSRVIQCVHKYGSKQVQTQLFESLKGELLNMAKSKYSAPLVKRMVKRGSSDQKRYITSLFMKNAKHLLKHKIGGHVVEYLYNMYANASERHHFSEQFYGPTFRLLNQENKPFKTVLESEPLQKVGILKYLKDALLGLVQKEALSFTLVHSLFLDYMTHAADQDKQAMAEVLQDYIPAILHSKEGAKVSMFALWFGTAKVRKVVIKSFKDLALKVALEEYGHLVLLGIFDVVDDTKLVQKVILSPLLKSLDELIDSRYGRRVLHYLLHPRDPVHFLPETIKMLQTGDGNPSSKKDMKVRSEELSGSCGEALISYATDHADSMIKDGGKALLLLSVLQYAAGDRKPAMEALAAIATAELEPGEGHIVEDAAAHIVFKKLLSFDKQRPAGEVPFAEVLLETIPSETVKSFVQCNRGCFFLLCMFETEIKPIVKKLAGILKTKKKELSKKPFKGASLLMKHIS